MFNFEHSTEKPVYRAPLATRYDAPNFRLSILHILIADDHKVVREALRSLLKEQQPLWEVSEAADGHEAVELFRKVIPDVAVLDIVMDPMGGVAAAYEIKRINPAAKIIFISSHYTTGQASVISRLLGAGAFVQKEHPATALVATIQRVLQEGN